MENNVNKHWCVEFAHRMINNFESKSRKRSEAISVFATKMPLRYSTEFCRPVLRDEIKALCEDIEKAAGERKVVYNLNSNIECVIKLCDTLVKFEHGEDKEFIRDTLETVSDCLCVYLKNNAEGEHPDTFTRSAADIIDRHNRYCDFPENYNISYKNN